MKPEIKAAWIAALRSGEYKQTRGKLHRSFRMTGDSLVEEYCCLGVLCDLHRKAQTGPDKYEWETTFSDHRRYIGDMDGLPEPVHEWAGLYNPDPPVEVFNNDGDKKRFGLSACNDGVSDLDAMNFEQIAKLIEEQL